MTRRYAYRLSYFRLIGLVVALPLTAVTLWQPLIGGVLLVPALVLLSRVGSPLADRLTDRKLGHAPGPGSPHTERRVACFGLLVGLVWMVVGCVGLVMLTAVGDWLFSGSVAWVAAALGLLVVVELPVVVAIALAWGRLTAR